MAKADRDGANPYLLWGSSRRGNYMQTPLVVGNWLFCCHDSGIATCYDKRTGENLWQERLPEQNVGFTSSPVSANGLVYWTSETGQVHVVRAGPKFQVLASNDLGEACMATPAISEDRLYFRCRDHLIAVGRP